MIDHITKITNERRRAVSYHIYYTTKWRNCFRKRTYGTNENLPLTAVNYMLAEEAECRTDYYETERGTQKVEIFTQR